MTSKKELQAKVDGLELALELAYEVIADLNQPVTTYNMVGHAVQSTAAYHLSYKDGPKYTFPINKIQGIYLVEDPENPETWIVFINNVPVFTGTREQADGEYQKTLDDIENIDIQALVEAKK